MPLDSRERSPRFRGAAQVRVITLFAVGAVAVAGGASTACVSTGRLYQVEQERDAYRNQAEKASHDSEAMAQEKKALEDQLAHMENKESALDAKLRENEEEQRKLQETYDGLIASMKKEMKAGQIEVTQMRDGLRVNVSQDILFDSGSAALDKNGIEVLGRVATQLKKSSQQQILVIGHTDNKPIGAALSKKYPSNWELAGARASSVVRLFDDAGLSNKRMLAVSVADSQPVASNKTEQGRAKNRRIEIRLRPIPSDDKRS
jgi:chemotaxis protein MotB